jgi:hypothetical protein
MTDKPSKTHYFVLRVRFDKPLDRKLALKIARDEFSGEKWMFDSAQRDHVTMKVDRVIHK